MRAALIPMKELAQAKMRLADVLDRRERSELALAMLTDVISACAGSGCFDQICVISNDSDVFWHARELGAKPLAEPATLGGGLNESLTFGQRYLARRVAVSELVILPADVPLARPEDVSAAVETLVGTSPRPAADPLHVVEKVPRPPGRVVLVRSRDNGTNMLAMRPPEALGMHFGRDSADAHRAAALSRGIEIIEIENERLAYDIDSAEDLTALASLPVGAATAGWLEARAHYAAGRG